MKFIERDNDYDNRVAGFDSPSQNRKNPPLRFIVLLSRVEVNSECIVRMVLVVPAFPQQLCQHRQWCHIRQSEFQLRGRVLIPSDPVSRLVRRDMLSSLHLLVPTHRLNPPCERRMLFQTKDCEHSAFEVSRERCEDGRLRHLLCKMTMKSSMDQRCLTIQ